MPVKLRLRRQGRKGRAYYHIVAADSRSPRDGKCLETVGTYDPTTVPATISLDSDLALKWLQNGAQPTDTVRAILRYTGVNLKHALIKQGKSEAEVERIFGKWMDEKQASISNRKAQIAENKAADRKQRLAQESKVRAEKAAAIAAKNNPVVEEAAPVEEAPAQDEAAEA